MDSAAIVEAFRTGNLVDLIDALALTGAEVIPMPEGGSILLGTVGSTGVVVSPDGAMVIHGHGEGNEILAQACQARMSKSLWGAMAAEIMEASAVGYAGKHIRTV